VRLLALGLAFALSAADQPQAIQRLPHDDTIYTVHGSADELTKFNTEVGSKWQGGTLLSKDAGKGEYRYWAYGERTAPEAREFIFGSMRSGLKLDIEAYDERQYFPAERSELDAIALKCGFQTDPFFITPQRELRVAPEPTVSFESVDCMLSALKTSKTLRALPTGFVGSVAVQERGR
jgi:hypothetical protein